MKVALAILLGSILGTLATVLILVLASLTRIFPVESEAITAFAVWFAFAGVFTLVMASTFGLAWHAFAQMRGWRSIHAYWPAGIVAGQILPTALVLFPTMQAGAWQPGAGNAWFVMALYGASLGGFTAIFAWLIRRPDRDAANPVSTNA